MFQQILKLLEIITTIFALVGKRNTSENASSEEPKTMPIDFETIKDAALGALKDSGAKDELQDLLKKHKGLFTDEFRGYFKAIVATFSEDVDQNSKYAEFLAALEDEKLLQEIEATAAKIENLVTRYEDKKELIKDLKQTVSKAVTKALIAALLSAVGPASGPLSVLLNSR